MVGVPGRSKGCRTCKKRRVKCDEQKPLCARCLKAGFECAGFGKDLNIKMSDFVYLDVAPPPRVKQPHEWTRWAVPPPQRQTGAIPAPSRVKASKLGYECKTVEHLPSCDEITLPPFMSLTAFKHNIGTSFLLGNPVFVSYGSPWLHHSAQGKLGTLAQQACQAFALCAFGRHHLRSEMELQSAVYYGEAVTNLRQCLSRSSRQGALAEMMVPIMILLLHSSLTAARAESECHLQGLQTLLETCGPEAFQQGPLHQAFLTCRDTLMTVALLKQQRTFLEQECWRSGPWSGDSTPKTERDRLIDVFVCVPGLLEDLHLLLSQSSPCQSDRQLLYARVNHQLRALSKWSGTYSDTNHHASLSDQARGLQCSALEVDLSASNPFHNAGATPSVLPLEYKAVLFSLLNIRYSLEGSWPNRTCNTKAADKDNATAAAVRDGQGRPPAALPAQSHSCSQGPIIDIPGAFSLRPYAYPAEKALRPRDSGLFWLVPVVLAGSLSEAQPDWSRWLHQTIFLSSVSAQPSKMKTPRAVSFYPVPKLG